MSTLIESSRIQNRILWIREQHVMLDTDLALLYGVPTKALNQAVRRNIDRFPDDFMFKLTTAEVQILRSQIVTLDHGGRGAHRKYAPYVFTEQGIAMLSSVLRSVRAVQVNIAIMRVFVRVRKVQDRDKDMTKQLLSLESRMIRQDIRSRRQSKHIRTIFRAIRALIEGRDKKEEKAVGPVGFLQ